MDKMDKMDKKEEVKGKQENKEKKEKGEKEKEEKLKETEKTEEEKENEKRKEAMKERREEMKEKEAQEKEKEQNSQELINKVEAALFLAARFLTMEELVRITGINPIMLREILEKIEEKYRNDGAMMIVKREVEGLEYWKMDVKQNFSHYVNKLASGKSEFSKGEQETLAVIAYKQPVKQSIIIKIRGNKAYDHIKHFIQADLIKSRRLGRTFELSLSENFFNYFHIPEKEFKKELENINENKNIEKNTENGKN